MHETCVFGMVAVVVCMKKIMTVLMYMGKGTVFNMMALMSMIRIAEQGAFDALEPETTDQDLLGRVVAARYAIETLGNAQYKPALTTLQKIAEDGIDAGCKISAVRAINKILNRPPPESQGYNGVFFPFGPNGPRPIRGPEDEGDVF